WRDAPFLLCRAVLFRTLARRAARDGATRSALVQRPVFFWGLRDAQLRLVMI
ncbi:hypothetical protein A2U01_0086254, partial [Trifolium medium]|nr:hypothetical protein [Trifolium medium]